MVLDSYAIRRDGWDGLFSGHATNFGLLEGAESSEVNADPDNIDDHLKCLSFKKKQQQGSKSRAKAIQSLASWR